MQVVSQVKQRTSGPAGVNAEDRCDQMIYHITHDVSATLRAIRTLPGWIREDLMEEGRALSAETEENLSMLETQAKRADQMLADLRDFSRVGRLSDAPSLVALDAVIDCAAADVGVPAGFEIRTDIAVPTLPGARNEIERMFKALISNAITHHDRDAGRVEITSLAANDMTTIICEDDGPGIEPDFRERVFDPMVTLRPRDECEGSGLGLSIARKIVETHGGTIRISDTTHERGCRVEIRWPNNKTDFD